MRQENTERTDLVAAGPAGTRPRDLVFDFAGKKTPDLGGLGLLLTASVLAEKDDRRVWVRALPHRTWEVLYALGLDHMFEFFPNTAELAN